MRTKKCGAILVAATLMSGCSTLEGYFPGGDEPVSSESVATAEVSAPVAATNAPISVVWSRDVDYRLPAEAPGFSRPVVAHVNGAERIVIGGQNRRAMVLDAGGSEVGRVALGAPGESGGLQLASGLVVVGDLDGKLTAIDPDAVSMAWQVDLKSALIGSPVAVEGGFIVQTVANQIYRFDEDGKKIWSFSGAPGGLSMHLKPSPVVANGLVYAVMSNADVVALKAANGSFVWKRQLLITNDASVLGELKVPVATPIVASAEHTGLDDSVLIVPVYQGELFMLSARDGGTISSRVISSRSEPLLVAGRIYVADAKGYLWSLSAANGDTVWKQKVSDHELSGPVLWHDQFWVADSEGGVYRLNRDGALQDSIDLAGRVDREPVATDAGVLVRNSLGTLYLLH